MTENTNNAPDTTTAELTPAPNGHHHSPGDEAATGPQQHGAEKGFVPLSKKQKKAQQRATAKAAASIAETASTATASTGSEASESVESALSPRSEVSSEAVSTPPPATAAGAPIEAPIGAPEGLRLRLKIWIHPKTATRYLMPSAFMRDIVNGQPVTDVMVAYAMRDDDTIRVTLTATQWNALPFFYFQEAGPAPRATSRPVDVIVPRGGPR